MHKSARLLTVGVFSLLLSACSAGESGTGPCEDCPAGHACVENACVPIDSDSDGTPDLTDACPTDANKVAPGTCGCGKVDSSDDGDGDGTPDCIDACPKNADKLAPDTCGCGELVATWSVPSRNLSALAYANGVLYATDLNTNPRSIIGFDGAGVASTVAALGTYTTVSLAASSTHLYVDDEAAQQTIHEISIATGQQTRTFKSALNGGNRGLGYRDGILWHLGYITDVGVTFLPIDVATGVSGTPISPKPANAVYSDSADATDDALFYVTRVDEYCSTSCPTVLHAIDTTGAPVCTQALGNTAGDVSGMAVGNGRFYVVSGRNILIFK